MAERLVPQTSLDAASTLDDSALVTERLVPIFPELRIAVRCHGEDKDPTRRILASSGWMDNAATFDLVAPSLAKGGWFVACLDLPGHGMSDHKPASSTYHAMDYAASIAQTADALWGTDCPPFVLLGHSMSAGLITVIAGAYAERVRAVMMIDGLGLSLRKAEDAVTHFKDSVAVWRAASSSSRGKESGYPSLAAAVDARLASVQRYPGSQYMSREAAERIVRRAIMEVQLPSEESIDGAAPRTVWRWRHDRRIAGYSILAPTDAHGRAFLSAMRCPTLLIRANKGWVWPEDVIQARVSLLQDALGKAGVPFVIRHLHGGHHLHVDPETADTVATALAEFLNTLS